MKDYYGVTPRGNFEGKNILHMSRRIRSLAAARSGLTIGSAFDAKIADAQDKLYAARAKRVWPGSRREDSRRLEWAHAARTRHCGSRLRA